MKSKLAELIATAGYAGYLPKAPGTAGALVAVLIFALYPYPLALAAACLAPGIWAAHEFARDRGVKDPQQVVIDEVLGQWIAYAGSGTGWKELAAGFLLFRLFDIFKPWPVRRLERLPGGWGIVIDDVMAGVYAAVVMGAARWFNLYS